MKKLKRNSKIIIVTSTRAEYGLLSNLIDIFYKDKAINFELIAIGQHLSTKYGKTLKQFKNKKVPTKKIKTLSSSSSTLSIINTFSNTINGFSKYISKQNIKLIILLGDRYEIFACATAAFFSDIKIAHIQGGEKTYGSMDDTFREIISKLSSIHFVSHKDYKKRLIYFGKNKRDIFNVGSLGAENTNYEKLKTKREIEQKYSINFKNRIFLATFNSSINDKISIFKTLKNFISCLKKFNDTSIIFTLPNSDINSDKIRDIALNYSKKNKNFKVFKSLGSVDYLSIMKFANLVIGNSSSGIFETPSFKVPTIDIGKRQLGRIKAKNIIQSNCNKKSIMFGINKALSKKFLKKIKHLKNPYYNGKTSVKIYKILKKI